MHPSTLAQLSAHSSVPAVVGGLPIALFGVGGYGATHFDILMELKKRGLVELCAVGDPALARLPAVRARLDAARIPSYESPRELLDRVGGIKAVSIAAPIPQHDELCRLALKRELFIYLEKPPVPLLQQWASLLALDDFGTSKKIAVAFQNIASLPVQTLKRWCTEGRLGKIEKIRIAAGWPRGRAYFGRNNWAGKIVLGDLPVIDGPATNGLAHVLHDAMFLASPEPDGFAVPLRVKAELYRARQIESYDTCSIRAELENGVELTAALTHACEVLLPYRIVVMGRKGNAWISADGNTLENDQGWAPLREESSKYRARSYENFIRYAAGQRSRPDTFLADTRGYTLLTNAMLLSSEAIHSLGPPHASIRGHGAEEVYAIHGVSEMLETTLRTGKSFYEQGIPWARGGSWVTTRGLRQISLQSYLPRPA